MTLLFLSCSIFLMMNPTDSSSTTTTSLHYLVRQPTSKTEKTPVLILLHGVGSNEKDLFSFVDRLPGKYLVIAARGPFVLGPGRYAWYQVDFSSGKPVINAEQEQVSRKMLVQFMDELKALYSFDEEQVYVGGFSQGAIMSYTIGLLHPDKIKGIVALSGRVLEEVKPQVTTSDPLKQLRVFISHGQQDNVLPITYARESDAYLKTLGIHPTFKEYSEGHGINADMLNDLISWLK